jgi:hypothetical protein
MFWRRSGAAGFALDPETLDEIRSELQKKKSAFYSTELQICVSTSYAKLDRNVGGNTPELTDRHSFLHYVFILCSLFKGSNRRYWKSQKRFKKKNTFFRAGHRVVW